MLTTDAPKHLSLLLVGDCLFLDILAFLTSQALDDGIVLHPHFVTSKDPQECQNEIRDAADRPIDLTFFSPYTYEYSVLLSPLLDRRSAGLSETELSGIVEQVTHQTNATLDAITHHISGSHVIVHDTSMLVREDSWIRRTIRSIRTRRVRQLAGRRVNDSLRSYLQSQQALTSQHLMMLGEAELVRRHGEHQMGKYLYRNELQHPAEMGRHLAAMYRDILFVKAYLSGRKVVICDLDNTLWDGVIGDEKSDAL